MAVQGNLDGTRRDEFTVGKDELRGIRADEFGNVILFDQEYGAATLTEMMAGGGSVDFGKLLFNRDGGLIYDNEGNVLLKKGL